MIKFNRPAFSLRGVIRQLAADGFTVGIEEGRVITNATRADLDKYVSDGTFPAEILKSVTLP